MSTKTGPRVWLKLAAINVAVTAVLFLLALGIVEIYLRATIPSSSGESIFQATLATRRYKVMKPDTRIVAWGSEFRTNSLGFRDVPVRPKGPSEFRIVVLGDSFTASAGVDYDKLYTTALEQRLKQRHPDTRVMNLAVGGYNIIQYDLVLEEVALALQPDLVLVSVFPFNDLSNDTYRANLADAEGRSQPAAATPWYQDTYVYRAYLGRVVARLRGMLQPPASASPQEQQEQRETRKKDAEENLAALERLVKRGEDNHVPVVVALLPNTDTYAAQRGDFEPFETLCAARGWRCVNLLDRFNASGADPESLRLNLLDFHPNDAYHQLVASGLADALVDRVGSH